MRAKTAILSLVVLWATVFAASILLSVSQGGGRNLEAGFRRLDTLLVWQFAALGIALVTAALAWSSKLSRGVKLIGYTPIGLTLLLVAALAAFVTFYNGSEVVTSTPTPQATTAPSAN